MPRMYDFGADYSSVSVNERRAIAWPVAVWACYIPESETQKINILESLILQLVHKGFQNPKETLCNTVGFNKDLVEAAMESCKTQGFFDRRFKELKLTENGKAVLGKIENPYTADLEASQKTKRIYMIQDLVTKSVVPIFDIDKLPDVYFEDDSALEIQYKKVYGKNDNALKPKSASVSQEYISFNEFVKTLEDKCGIRKYKAQAICEVIFASMDIFRRNYSHGTNSIYQRRELQSGEVKYQFKTAINSYFNWVEKGFNKIQEENKDGALYILNTEGQNAKEMSTILGILESLDVLQFEMTGGANSQLYIYVNQIRNLKNILNNPGRYKNRLLETVSERHLISVQMLTYIYEGGFTNEEIWDIIEDYFLGKIPEKVKSNCKKEDPNISFDN